MYKQQLSLTNPKLFTKLLKIYKDNRKYKEEEYNILNIRLQVFFDYYKKIRLDNIQFYLVFFIMLKRKVADFYYNMIIKRLYDFCIIVDLIRSYFKTKENR